MGEDAVGRPNNTAGNDYLRQWIAFRRPRTSEVVVMIDRDAPDSPAAFGALRTIIDEGLVGEVLAARFRTLRSILTAAEVSTMQGAVSLARLLNAPPAGRSVTIAAPPLGHKDVRDWFRAGAKNDDLWGATEQGIKLPGRRLAGVGYAVGGAA